MSARATASRAVRACLLGAVLSAVGSRVAHAQCGGWVHDFASYGSSFPGYYFGSPTLLDRDGIDGAQLPRIVGFVTGVWDTTGDDLRLMMMGDEDWITIADVPPSITGSIVAWDSDGAGPASSRVYFVLSAPDSTGSYLASRPWPRNASGAHPLPPVTSPVHVLTTWDPDGPGPERETVVIGVNAAPTSAYMSMLMWSGSNWQVIGGPVLGIRSGVTKQRVSPDEPDRLVLYGGGSAVHSFDGASWTEIGLGAFNGRRVRDIEPWDHDGDAGDRKSVV